MFSQPSYPAERISDCSWHTVAVLNCSNPSTQIPNSNWIFIIDSVFHNVFFIHKFCLLFQSGPSRNDCNTHPQVNANLKANTTDELLSRKKSMHLTAFKYRIDEIKNELQVCCLRPRLPMERFYKLRLYVQPQIC